jgi:hypothetical protein
MLILLFLLIVTTQGVTVLPSCADIKIPQGLAIFYYGECGQCLPMTSTVSISQTDSFFVDCPNNRFILYRGVGCVAQNLSSYNPFRPYFCSTKACCMFRKMGSQFSGQYTYFASFVYNDCTGACIGEATAGDYFSMVNDTYAIYHKTNTCADTQGNNIGIKICESAAPLTMTTTTNNNKIAATSDADNYLSGGVGFWFGFICIILIHYY